MHNHPTGDPTPSPEDQEVTRRLREAGELMGIKVLDHIIIGSAYYSFTERGIYEDGNVQARNQEWAIYEG